MHYSRSDATRAHAVGHMHAASASWAALCARFMQIDSVARSRGGSWSMRRSIWSPGHLPMYKSLDAARVPDNAVLMPSPGFGDNFFFLMALTTR